MPTYFVTGATGRQGRAVASSLLASGHKVHALVRDLTSPASIALQDDGAILFPGTFSDIDSLSTAAAGSQGVFINVSPSAESGAEAQHAKNVISAALSAGVQHVIYSSVLKAGSHAEFPDFDEKSWMGSYWLSKHAIEELVRNAGFETWTILRPGFFMTNLLPPLAGYMYPELWADGAFKHAYDNATKLFLVDPEDIGHAAAAAFEEPARWGGREVDLVGDPSSVEDMVTVLKEVSGRDIRIEGFENGEEVEGFRAKIVESQRFAATVNNLSRFAPDLSDIKKLGLELKGWRAFLEEKKKRGEV